MEVEPQPIEVEPQAVEVEVLSYFYNDIQECIAQPGGVAVMLFSEGVVSEEVLDQAELFTKSPSEKNAEIMSAVTVAVKANPKRVWILIAVLEKGPKSAPVASRMRGALEIHGVSGE